MNVQIKSKVALASAALVSVLLMAGSTVKARPYTVVDQGTADTIATEAYEYFFPLVLMDITRRQTTNSPSSETDGFGPMNQFVHFRSYPDASFKTVVRPNFDTLYSTAWVDLTQEPMIVSVPETHGRYYLLPMLDMWTDVFSAPGKRTSGTKAGRFALVGPGWIGNLPDDVTRVDAPTNYVWIIGRTQTNGPKDYAAVHQIQDGFQITPLFEKSSQKKQFPSSDPNIDMATPPLDQVLKMPSRDYFTYAAELLKANPPHVSDGSMILRLRQIGIQPGESLSFDQLGSAVQQALERGAQQGLRDIEKFLPKMARLANGWQMNTDTMGVYGNFYLKRAAIAMAGLGANQPEDAVYPLNISDAEGKPMTGDHQYILHFDKNELPPVDAFWSVTMYDESGFAVPNPINRFAIGDRDPLRYNSDGSLDIFIQNGNPGSEKIANWLPAPDHGKLGVTMRLYAPRPEVLTGEWAPPAVKRSDLSPKS